MNHIYIIEDDSVLCSELALALEAVGYHTTCANDFNNVLNEFLLVSPDLVILDINLPNTNVLCENLKASHDFRILKNIGYDIHTLEKITLYHLSAIFIIPLFSAVLFSFFISFTYCRSCGALYFVPFKKLLFCFFVSIIVFTLLYGIYFAICFTSLRKEIIFTD